MQEQTLPPDFAALPQEEQARILIAVHEMTQLAFAYTTGIIIAPPPSIGGAVVNGSASILTLSGIHYLITAWHVVKSWLDRTDQGERLNFQVADALLDPKKALVWSDPGNDIGVLGLRPEERAAIPILASDPAPDSWPPPHPAVGDYVLISGFPAVVREQPRPEEVELNAISTMLQVSSVGERHLVCQFLREEWVSTNWRDMPPPGTDLGGTSGGPVLLVRNLTYPLIGLVSEFSPTFELLNVRTLSHLPSTFPTAGA